MATPPVPRQRRPLPSGLLLIRAATSAVEVWAARGVVPVDVAPLEHGWVVVVPATGRTAVEPPYDDPVVLLVNRPVPARMRPAIGLVVRGGEAVVCVAARGWRSGRRWLAWSPGEGLVPPGGLPVLSLPSLVAASGVADPGALDALRAVGSDVAGAPRDFLVDLLAVLGLPGGPLLDGSALVGDDERCRRVLPDGRAVAGLEGAVHEERLWHEELGL